MKNFILTILVFVLIASAAPSYSAQKMRDMSLSVERTNQQLSEGQTQNNNTGNTGFGEIGTSSGWSSSTGFDADVQLDPNLARQMREIKARNAAQDATSQEFEFNTPFPDNAVGNSFIGTVNNQNGKPLPSGLPSPRRGNNQNIITIFCSSNYTPKTEAGTSQKSCMETQRQEACERFARASVNIQRVLNQAIDCEANTSGGYTSSGCDGLDANRLDLLKQYWQDEDSSYTILFLPDMVLNSAANCAASVKRGK